MFWFDAHESLQLSPGAVLKLFRLIGEHALRGAPRRRAGDPPVPGAASACSLTHDQQRNTRFQYLRCPRDHGRLITFVDFLREKDFIRPLSPQQIDELRQNVQTVNCSNCGAPIDLDDELVVRALRLAAVDARHEAGRRARQRSCARPPRSRSRSIRRCRCELERARREVEAAFASFDQRAGLVRRRLVARGLVGAGLSSLARWLKTADMTATASCSQVDQEDQEQDREQRARAA